MGKKVFNVFDSNIFPIKIDNASVSEYFNLKILTSKQMLQRLPVALAQVKTGNIWKFTKWNETNNVYFLLSERNCWKNIQQYS